MSNQNKILTTLNQPLKAQLYALPIPQGEGANTLYDTISGLPVGTSDNSESGEIAVKVVIVGQRPATGAEGNGISNSGPAANVVEVTPDDSNDLPHQSRGLLINDAGDIKITDINDNTTTIEDVVPGSILPIQVARVWATGTTCALIYNLY